MEKRRILQRPAIVALIVLALTNTAPAEQANYEYDATGQLTHATTNTSAASYQYDEVGNLLSVTTDTTQQQPPSVQLTSADCLIPGTATIITFTGQNLLTTAQVSSGNQALTLQHAVINDQNVDVTTTIPSTATPGPVTYSITTRYGTANRQLQICQTTAQFTPPVKNISPLHTSNTEAALTQPLTTNTRLYLQNNNPITSTAANQITIPPGESGTLPITALSPGTSIITSGETNVTVYVPSGTPADFESTKAFTVYIEPTNTTTGTPQGFQSASLGTVAIEKAEQGNPIIVAPMITVIIEQ